jgi:hypothetical protein
MRGIFSRKGAKGAKESLILVLRKTQGFAFCLTLILFANFAPLREAPLDFDFSGLNI